MTNKDVKLTDGIRNEAVFNQVFSNEEIAKTFFEKFLKLKKLEIRCGGMFKSFARSDFL